MDGWLWYRVRATAAVPVELEKCQNKQSPKHAHAARFHAPTPDRPSTGDEAVWLPLVPTRTHLLSAAVFWMLVANESLEPWPGHAVSHRVHGRE